MSVALGADTVLGALGLLLGWGLHDVVLCRADVFSRDITCITFDGRYTRVLLADDFPIDQKNVRLVSSPLEMNLGLDALLPHRLVDIQNIVKQLASVIKKSTIFADACLRFAHSESIVCA